MTLSTRAVLESLLAAEGEVFGLDIVRTTALGPGTIYPILQRLRAAGWVTARWEAPEHAHQHGRPPRRYYRLTAQGQARAVHALQPGTARGDVRRPLRLANPATGRGWVEGT
jgi:DNA-binding PadR family transcriptional regulator